MTASRSFSEWLCWQETLHSREIALGLDRVAQVWQRMGIDKPAKTVITVAGTNGKGSCVALLESIMASCGLQVAAYTSPHLLRYNERLRIRGRELDDQIWRQAFERVEQARGDTPLTYYEFGTLSALQIIAAAEVDLALLEVGLGGRLDAVNIIDADCAVVTQIGIDHVDWLGSTREQIGREKAGIFRPGAIAVCGDPKAPASVGNTAFDLGSRYFERGRDFSFKQTAGRWQWQGPSGIAFDLALPALKGLWQLDNAAACLMALFASGLIQASDQRRVELGLVRVVLPGRLQILQDKPQILVDVAHNPDAMSCLCQWLAAHPVGAKTRVVFAALADKNVAEMVAELRPVTDYWYLAGLQLERGLSVSDLAERIGSSTGRAAAQSSVDVRSALLLARSEASELDRILVCGSFHTVAAALTAMG